MTLVQTTFSPQLKNKIETNRSVLGVTDGADLSLLNGVDDDNEEEDNDNNNDEE